MSKNINVLDQELKIPKFFYGTAWKEDQSEDRKSSMKDPVHRFLIYAMFQ